MQLNVYDMDGTIIDSTNAIKQCQIEGLYRATGNDVSQLEQLLKEKGLKGALSHLDIDQDIFYKVHYKTFDPFEAAKNGNMKVFDDVKEYFQKTCEDRDDYKNLLLEYLEYPDDSTFKELYRNYGIINCLISNSSIDATWKKLMAVGANENFDLVYAEFEKDKAKPTSYMANALLNRLKNFPVGQYNYHVLDDIGHLTNVGDNLVDIDFGKVLYDLLASNMEHKPTFNNYLVDRDGRFNPMPDVYVIRSFDEISKV
jgi:phosphoglycolate phosphatase-like HAD superfamily hydrolase